MEREVGREGERERGREGGENERKNDALLINQVSCFVSALKNFAGLML